MAQENRRKEVILDFIKKQGPVLCFFAAALAILYVVFILSNADLAPLNYAVTIITLLGAEVVLVSMVKTFRAAAERDRIVKSVLAGNTMSEPSSGLSLAEADYRFLVSELKRRSNELQIEAEKRTEINEQYLTNWVHQIKTPIAVIRMQLATVDTEESRAVLNEVFRIEQYVEMVLQYIRLDSKANDLVIKDYSLDVLIRSSIKKYSTQFIAKKISLNYDGTTERIITDQKWFGCILDQLISNAIKYTQKGGITIRVDENKIVVSDTGIGIAPEDLPCIFEKGYTGINGRLNQKASGLGLYLAKSAASMLSLSLYAESTPGQGSIFTIEY